MFDLQTYAIFVNIFLVAPVNLGVATKYTKLPGKVIRE